VIGDWALAGNLDRVAGKVGSGWNNGPAG